jgi:large subunit ribosomal protein L23
MSDVKNYSAERLLKIILAPIISEKSTRIADKNSQFIFRVTADATKGEIKAAVESILKKDVESVQVVNVKGKKKRTGQRIGRRKDWKKAYICLKAGQDIDLTSGEIA